jgi:hypothetical protein
MRKEATSMKPFIGIAGGMVLMTVAGAAAFVADPQGDPRQFAMTVLVGALGVAVGWLIGLLASPYGADEEKRFSRYAATVSAFLSGYALSKIEPTLTFILADGKLVTQQLYGVRVMVFLICLIAASITMYVFRIYTDLDEPARRAAASETSP